jgi:hypothetical protein
MANFQFTVRATDSDGAFADRNFSITINNTRVERYLTVDNLNAYTSPDLINWTTRNGQGGHDCAYGNSMWLIVTNGSTVNSGTAPGTVVMAGGQSASAANSGLIIRKSTDGVNFSTVLYSGLVFTKPDGTVFTPPAITANTMIQGRLSFSNGYFWLPMAWSNDFSINNTPVWQNYIGRSADGINWTVLPAPFKGNFGYASSVGHYWRYTAKVQDSGSDLFIPNCGNGSVNGMTNTMYGWRSADLGLTWTAVVDSTGKLNGSSTIVSYHLTRINGLYLAGVVTAGGDRPFMVSNDGFNWSPCNAVSGWTTNFPVNNIVYANGTLYAMSNLVGSTSSNYARMMQSTDGINWMPAYSIAGEMSSGSPIYTQNTTLLYKNGYLITANNSPYSTNSKPFTYNFAGSGDPVMNPNTPNSGTPVGIPFSYSNGFAAMGS